jgi:asparagine synthase (glutamine-hydrolysing)
MCGIAGQVRYTDAPFSGHVAGMVDRLHHRGPDDSGLWVSAQNECVLGHTRLSIIDLSDAGHQPMIDRLTGNAITFNGEIYNFLELRQACEKAGDTFTSHSDTEVILALYRRHGVECLQHLRGMFSFALWDAARRHLFVARDRLGKKPFNYALTTNQFTFASEIDALVQHPGVSSQMDHEALELYLQLQYVPAPWTIYREIRKLPPAHFGIYDQSGMHLQRYWNVDYRAKQSLSEAEALDGLQAVLQDAVRLRLTADVPVGALLSGGVDSSIIVALMAGLKSDPVQTFSIGFSAEAFNELPYANFVAEKFRTRHYPRIIDANVQPLLANIVRRYGEPYADSSAIPSFLVCSAARQEVAVVMNGDGGDELLGGYHRYWLKPVSIWLGHLLGRLHSADKLADWVVGLDRAQSFAARARRKWLLRVTNPELLAMLNGTDFWNRLERNALICAETALLHDWMAEWLARAREVADNPIDRMLWMDNQTYLPGDLLVKMDIASMHCGLETRSPLLDHKVIEYCAALPVNYKVKNGVGKYLLKKLAERYFPKNFVHRAKMGFGIPLADWLRGSLRDTLEATLHNRDAMAPFDAAVVQRTLNEFLNHNVNHASRLWALLMFGLWRQHADALGK